MATLTLKGVNRTYRTSAPPSKIPAGEERGRVHYYYDQYSWTTNSVIADVVTLMRLPAGARIIDAVVSMNDNGTAGEYDIGYVALDSNETTDADAFFDGFNPEGTGGNAASLAGAGGTAGTGIGVVLGNSVALFKKLAGDVDVTVTVGEASNVGSGTLTIKVGIMVVFD